MVMGEFTKETDVLVIGAGPGGYAAAFRAADLGLDVTLVNAEPKPGGACVHRGCIPGKTLLYYSGLIHETERVAEAGIKFSRPEVDLDQLRNFKNNIIARLSGGLVDLCRHRKIEYIQARAVFEDSTTVRLADNQSDYSRISFRRAILAPGSNPRPMPGVDVRGGLVMDSRAALQIPEIPEKLLVVGGGYIGLELGSMYAALGSRVTLVEMTDRLIAEVDRDLLRILKRELDRRFEAINTRCKVAEIEERDNDVRVAIEGEESYEDQYDRVLIAIGRQPRTEGLDLDRTDAALDDRGFIQVNQHLQTDDPHLYAVGDAVAQPMLAHKAMQEGKIAAEHIAGQPAVYDARAIPAVIYTFPEVAWCGLTEQEAKNQGRDVTVSRFKWTASGRAASLGLKDGLTKLVIDPQTDQVLGMGITGKDAGELIAEGVLAVEMGAVVEDLARTVHPHPTLSEGVFEAAGAYAGFPTHVLPIK